METQEQKQIEQATNEILNLKNELLNSIKVTFSEVGINCQIKLSGNTISLSPINEGNPNHYKLEMFYWGELNTTKGKLRVTIPCFGDFTTEDDSVINIYQLAGQICSNKSALDKIKLYLESYHNEIPNVYRRYNL